MQKQKERTNHFKHVTIQVLLPVTLHRDSLSFNFSI